MKRYTLLLFVFLITISLTACLPINIGPLTIGKHTYEGYVFDVETDEPIQGAKIKLADETIYTDEEGYFEFKHSFESLTPRECSAEGYGRRTVTNLRFNYDTINLIYLLKSKGIYGYTSFEGTEKLEVLLTGQTIEGKDYRETTEFNEKGYFYFREVPHHMALDLYIYDKDEDKESALYTQKTDPVEISQQGIQYFDIPINQNQK